MIAYAYPLASILSGKVTLKKNETEKYVAGEGPTNCFRESYGDIQWYSIVQSSI